MMIGSMANGPLRRASMRLAVTGVLTLIPGLALGAGPGIWNGFYAGGQIGINYVQSDGTSHADGFTYGVLGGYDYQLLQQHIVIGGDIFYEDNLAKNHASIVGPLHYGTHVWGADFRVGYPVGSKSEWLPYIKLGYGRVYGTNDLSGNAGGPRYGVGAEWRINAQWSIMAQFMHEAASSNVDNLINNNWTVGANWRFGGL